MTKTLRPTAVAFVLLGITAGALAAEYYKLSDVKRVEQDLYRSGGLYIQTRYCYHYTYGEEAILKWDADGSYDNKIIWDDGSNCAVKAVWRR